VDLLQDIIVALVALGAAAVVVRRVVGEFRDEGAEPACDHCGKNDSPTVTPETPQSAHPEA